MLYTTSQAACQAGNPGNIIPAAASAGSTDTFTDSWTIGYTNDYVIGVWAGNDDIQPMINVTGADGAAQIWHELMLRIEQGMPIRQFPGPPANVVKKTVSDLGLTTTDWHLK